MILSRLLNRLLAHDAAATAELGRYAGRTVRLVFPVISDTLTISAEGRFADHDQPAEATLRLPLAFFIAFMFDRTAAQQRLALEGDAELAAGVGRVLGGIRWDLADELSQLVGDVAANRLVWLAGKVGGVPGAIGSRMALHLIEYWRDEASLLADKDAVARFCGEVDTLRDDVARLDKRLQQLLKKSA
ncbi:ubiquinone biosynthesis accessory factor UbiJ [Chitiniphilus eburneus]|uniref:Ubiquinone biosynthesis accessory factor UbiJ n=1 Tax=Chitiniphilus eburneus TaxID=2571148 RepID=A0A4U0PWV4_9NEIS|nr:SCP2 sterol-binding domain-containing protein [Chitiniphilus eburneus]TJZ73025.1 sterol-binding protein [Chitiniphilus eburneus]